GLPEAAKGPAFAVAAGLLVYPQAAHLEHFEPPRTRQFMTGTGGYMARVGRWLRESFCPFNETTNRPVAERPISAACKCVIGAFGATQGLLPVHSRGKHDDQPDDSGHPGNETSHYRVRRRRRRR